MKRKLLNCLPGVRWAPSDLPSSSTNNGGEGDKKPHRTYSLFTSRNSTKTKLEHPNHGHAYRRRSAISLHDIPDHEVGQRVAGQEQSAFFAKMPVELRRMVYEYVYSEETVHLTMGAKRRFGHFVCDGAGEGRECGCKVLVGGREGNRLGSEEVGLLRVCRRMYSEAVPHLYMSHIFSLLHLTHLLYLPSRLPAPRIDTIRTLRLRWAIRALPYLRRGPSKRLAYPEDTSNWGRGWAILASMESLRDLYVVLVDPSRDNMWERNWNELEGFLLEPIKDVTRPWSFELVLPYASCQLEHDMGDSPVVLRKPEGGGDDEEDQ